MFKIEKTGYYAQSEKVEVEVLDEKYDTKVEAVTAAEIMSIEEAKELNKGREKPYPFQADEDGSEKFAFIVRFWDGDDYRPVTGYAVKEVA